MRVLNAELKQSNTRSYIGFYQCIKPQTQRYITHLNCLCLQNAWCSIFVFNMHVRATFLRSFWKWIIETKPKTKTKFRDGIWFVTATEQQFPTSGANDSETTGKIVGWYLFPFKSECMRNTLLNYHSLCGNWDIIYEKNRQKMRFMQWT